MTSPLFVFGIARSGTNLIAAMLDAHSQVTLARDPLLPFFKSLRNAAILASGRPDLTERYPATAAHQDYYFEPLGRDLLDLAMSTTIDLPVGDPRLAESIAARAGLESQALRKQLRDLRGDTHRELLDNLLTRLGGTGQQWHGIKEVWTAEYIPVLARAYSDARFIVIRRDPRAVISSLLVMAEKDPTQAAHPISFLRHWRKEAAVVHEIRRETGLNDRVMIVSYEGLATDPETEFQRVVSFLGLEDEPAVFAPGRGPYRGGNSSYGEVSGISDRSIDRWREVLDPAMVRTIEYHCAPEMVAEGYSLADNSPDVSGGEVERIVFDADRNAGSWRSDSGDPDRDLRWEAERWGFLRAGAGYEPRDEDIRKYFLFESFFHHLLENSTLRPLSERD